MGLVEKTLGGREIFPNIWKEIFEIFFLPLPKCKKSGGYVPEFAIRNSAEFRQQQRLLRGFLPCSIPGLALARRGLNVPGIFGSLNQSIYCEAAETL
jgi:hypothetical protein